MRPNNVIHRKYHFKYKNRLKGQRKINSNKILSWLDVWNSLFFHYKIPIFTFLTHLLLNELETMVSSTCLQTARFRRGRFYFYWTKSQAVINHCMFSFSLFFFLRTRDIIMGYMRTLFEWMPLACMVKGIMIWQCRVIFINVISTLVSFLLLQWAIMNILIIK